MALIVQKFGGTSLADLSLIESAALKVKKALSGGDQVIVVVSAMAGVTNELVNKCYNISDLQSDSQKMEYDSLISNGENISCALMALALQKHGVESRSFQGWQVPIVTSGELNHARISSIGIAQIHRSIKARVTPVIAGFQGVDTENRITTIGRGGSDTSAVAIAAAVAADRCEIYTDVEGVFTADPRIVKDAKKIDYITYEDMVQISQKGAKVLHPEAADIAARNHMPITIFSSFKEGSGTIISHAKKKQRQATISHLSNMSEKKSRVSIIGPDINLYKEAISCMVKSYDDFTELESSITILVDLEDAEDIVKQLHQYITQERECLI